MRGGRRLLVQAVLAAVAVADITGGGGGVGTPARRATETPRKLADELQGQPRNLTVLDLQAKNLVGSIPPWISEFTELRTLRLRGLRLQGGLPHQLGGLTQLRELSVNYCHLTGPIPPELGRLPHLTDLNLNQNSMSGSLPEELASLSKLRLLRLGWNSFRGDFPAAICRLRGLRQLILNANRLKGQIPRCLGELQHLQKLQFGGNQLTGTIPAELGNLSRLTHLIGHTNPLTGGIPTELGRLKKLQTISLRKNRLSGSLPRELGGCKQLQELSVEKNVLSGGIPSEIGRLTQLRILRLDGNNFSGSVPKELGSLSKLEILNLGFNQLSGTVHYRLRLLESLKELSLCPNNHWGRLPDVSRMSKLKKIDAHGCAFHGIRGSSIPDSVTTIDFSDNNFKGMPSQLYDLPQLVTLNLAGNSLSAWPSKGVIPKEYHPSSFTTRCGYVPADHGRERLHWPALGVLNVSGNAIGGEVRDFLYSLGYLPSLSILVARNCSLSGAITWDGWNEIFAHTGDCFYRWRSREGGFPMLVTLDLSANLIDAIDAVPVNSLMMADFSHNRLRTIHGNWFITLPQMHLSSLILVGNPDLQVSILSPRQCPQGVSKTLMSDLNGFHPVVGELYECTELCHTRVWSEIDDTVNESLCRCQAGASGSGKACMACPRDAYSVALDAAAAARECRTCPEGSGTRGASMVPSAMGCICQDGFRKVVDAKGELARCEQCPPGKSLEAERGACKLNELFLFRTGLFIFALLCIGLAAPLFLALAVPVLDVSKQEGATVVQTASDHHVLFWRSVPVSVTFRGTGSGALDGVPHMALATGPRTLRLSSPLAYEPASSCGTVLFGPRTSILRRGVAGVPVPAVMGTFTLAAGATVWGLGAPVSHLLLEALVGLVLGLAAQGCRRWHAFRTPLVQRRRAFLGKLLAANPAPKRVPRGPARGISLEQLVAFHDAFHAFLRERTMYYVVANMVSPLTRSYKLSYAELAGAGQLEWFVSHFWGTPFQEFVAAIRKHADSKDQPAKVRYWICSFSNCQHEVGEELGGKVEDSSFYLALRSPDCRGTVMVLDEDCRPLTRSWCIFEVLQTLELSTEGDRFAGLELCTSSGSINRGTSSTDAAMAVARRIVDFRCEDASASKEADKAAIEQAIQVHHGGFKSVNAFVRRNILTALTAMQRRTSDRFDTMTGTLRERLEEDELASGVVRRRASADSEGRHPAGPLPEQGCLALLARRPKVASL